jgi:hypothetical protein
MNYRFSAGIVYNNFPWPLAATAKQRHAIEEAAQAVLDVRVKYPVSSLADRDHAPGFGQGAPKA